MELPIYGYGNSVLKTSAAIVEKDFHELDKLIADMWETMENAQGCGLAAPQIGKSLQLFVADSKIVFDRLEKEQREKIFVDGDVGIREVFINAQILSQSDEKWNDAEGCLSIPTLSGKVPRSWTVEVEYQNQKFETIRKKFSGMTARVIQHEYDHTQGILYIDRVQPLSKKLMEGKLKKVVKGKINTFYKLKYK